MKKRFLNSIKICLPVFFAMAAIHFSRGQDEIQIQKQIDVLGQTKPDSRFTRRFQRRGRGRFEVRPLCPGLHVSSRPDAAQYQISGSSGGGVQGRVVDRFSKNTLLSRSYNGAPLRRQAHAFADDIVQAITGKKGIAQTKIAFKVKPGGGNGEIYVADFDGHNAQAVTHDNTIVAAPAWVPGQLALYYTSYKLGNPDIFYHNLSTGQRRVVAGFSGLNTSAAVSPDGTKVAMILSKSGSPDVWVCNADGSNLKQLTADAGGRIVAVLVAGRAMDLFRDEN